MTDTPTQERSVRELFSTLATKEEQLALLVAAIDSMNDKALVDQLYDIVEQQKASPEAAFIYDTADVAAAGGDLSSAADAVADAKAEVIENQNQEQDDKDKAQAEEAEKQESDEDKPSETPSVDDSSPEDNPPA